MTVSQSLAIRGRGALHLVRKRVERALRKRDWVLRLLVASRFVRVLDRDGLRLYAAERGRLWLLDEGLDSPGVDRPHAGPLDPELLRGAIRPRPADASRRVGEPPPWQLDSDFVCELADVTLLRRKPVVVTADGQFVLDSITATREDNRTLEETLRRVARAHGFGAMRRGFSGRSRIEGRGMGLVCLLTDGLQRSYYHWMLEQLTKLRGVDEFRRRTGETPTLVLPRGRHPWMRELIELVGYGDAKVVRWRGREAHARRIVLPAYPSPTPASCRWLRERVLGERSLSPAAPRTTRVLIARGEGRRWWRRAIVNHEELEESLEPLGFRSYHLAEMPVAEQADLFDRAEVVVGAHGAGLTNIVFSNRAKVVELFGRDVRPHYFRLAHVLGLPYRYVLSDPAPARSLEPPRGGRAKAARDPDLDHGLRVDTERLRSVLAEMDIR